MALGFSETDIKSLQTTATTTTTTTVTDGKTKMHEMAFKILHSWKTTQLALAQHATKAPTRIGDTAAAGAPQTSALDDLIDALQSLGYFEAVEIVEHLRSENEAARSVDTNKL